ncbi:hypothetical protein EDD21DRAFT_411389, partial [Dissophora ornata]
IHKATVTLDPTESAKHRQDVVVELEKVDALLRNAPRKESDADGPFFLGEKFTFADLAIAPFLARFFLVTAFQEKAVAAEFEKSLQGNEKVKRFLEWRDAAVQRESVQKATPEKEVLEDVYRKFISKSAN